MRPSPRPKKCVRQNGATPNTGRFAQGRIPADIVFGANKMLRRI